MCMCMGLGAHERACVCVGALTCGRVCGCLRPFVPMSMHVCEKGPGRISQGTLWNFAPSWTEERGASWRQADSEGGRVSRSFQKNRSSMGVSPCNHPQRAAASLSRLGLTPNSESYSSTIEACEREQQWQWAGPLSPTETR